MGYRWAFQRVLQLDDELRAHFCRYLDIAAEARSISRRFGDCSSAFTFE
jgi:hypothetical protein